MSNGDIQHLSAFVYGIWACGSLPGETEEEDVVVAFWFTGLVSS